MAAPITPTETNLDGKVVTVFIAETSTGATTVETVTLETHMPKIDLRKGHPILSMAYITKETDTTGTENLTPQNEMARGTLPDSTGEWQITDESNITFYKTADQNGILAITYLAFGAQLA